MCPLRYCGPMSPRLHPPANPPAGFDAALVDAGARRRAGARLPRLRASPACRASGKSTLAAQVAALARSARPARGSAVDRRLLPRPARAAATGAATVHPLLATRGPPGTHDVALACDDARCACAPASRCVCRASTSSPTRACRPRVGRVARDDATSSLFEGWFLKTPPQDGGGTASSRSTRVERDEDPDGDLAPLLQRRRSRATTRALWSRHRPPAVPAAARLRHRAANGAGSRSRRCRRGPGSRARRMTAAQRGTLRAVVRTRQPAGVALPAGDRRLDAAAGCATAIG